MMSFVCTVSACFNWLFFVRSHFSVFEKIAVSRSVGFSIVNRFPPFALKSRDFAFGYFLCSNILQLLPGE